MHWPFAFGEKALESPPGTYALSAENTPIKLSNAWGGHPVFTTPLCVRPAGTPQPLRMDDGSPNPIWNIRMEYTRTW